MKRFKQCDLELFGSEIGGGDEIGPAITPQTEETAGETMEACAPDAGEAIHKMTREEEFRARMEGEYKDLFTAYFQETFNRRFREQRSKIEELERAQAVVEAAAERYGTRDVAELVTIIRARETEAPTAMESEAASVEKPPDAVQNTDFSQELAAQSVREAVAEAEARVRAETVREVLDSIRARGLRPTESALSTHSGHALGATRLSRAQRADMARRAARGEHIEF